MTSIIKLSNGENLNVTFSYGCSTQDELTLVLQDKFILGTSPYVDISIQEEWNLLSVGFNNG